MSVGHPSPALHLSDLVSNTLVLRQLAPYIPVQSLLALTATSHDIRHVLFENREAFRYLNLSHLKRVQISNAPLDPGGVSFRSQRMDEALTQDEFISGPLRGIFSALARKHVLANVQTMVLDRLGVTAELVDEIISEEKFNVRTLSIRSCILNEAKLMQVLKYAVRQTRSNGMPRLKALYFFGPEDSRTVGMARRPPATTVEAQQSIGTGVMSSEGAQIGAEWNFKSQNALHTSVTQCEDRWYHSLGRLIRQKPDVGREWAQTIKACEGIIAFDAVLCRGPRHDMSQLLLQEENRDSPNLIWLPPAIANVALGGGCKKCGTMPEDPATFGSSPSNHLPLLDPPPLHQSTISSAQQPHLISDNKTSFPPLFVRCEACLRARWCERCLKWWCEDCYSASEAGTRTNEVSPTAIDSTLSKSAPQGSIKVVMGLCTENCLRLELMVPEAAGCGDERHTALEYYAILALAEAELGARDLQDVGLSVARLTTIAADGSCPGMFRVRLELR